MTNLLTDRTPVDPDIKYRTFVCVSQPNTRYQIVEGPKDSDPGTTARPNPNAPLVTFDGVIHKTTRVGDKFVEFVDGLCSSADPDVIRWCEANYPTVLDMEKAESSMLVAIARMQVERSNYEPEVSTDLVSPTASNLKALIDAEVARQLAEREAKPSDEGSS
jgi:hypothetical protein